MIQNIFSAVTAADFATLSQLLCKVHASFKESLADTKLDGYFSQVETGADTLIVSIKKSSSALSMDEADSKRDTTLRNFFTTVEGATVSLFSDEEKAAKKVLEVMNKYGRKIVNEKLLTESAHIESLLKDLEKEDTAALLSKIHCGKEYFEALKADEESFKALQVQNNSASDSASAEKSSTEIKKALRDYINSTLIPYINAMSTIESEKYSKFASEIAREINKTNDIARKSKKSSAKQTEKSASGNV